MHIQFLGATQTVTGSKYLIKADQTTLLVDCGLFQGLKKLRLRNWNPLPINPATIDYVLLTHAHIDHSGYIPLLVKNGFRGKILCTEATRDLCSLLLPDSGKIQEEQARYANLKGYSKHQPALPLYTRDDAEKALAFFKVIDFDRWINLTNELAISFHYVGHILGASFIQIKHYDLTITFTGDVGRFHDPILYPPKDLPNSDYLVMESTYGNRIHEKTNPEDTLLEVINRTAKRGGTTVIPSFAVGRAQSILYYIHQLKARNEIPDIPVYIDSPMATNATKLFYQHAKQHQLTKEESADVCRTAKYVQNVKESMSLDNQDMPIIIISASGMATGGRVLHHIKHLAPDHRNTILFCGYQANGTRGDRMVRGEKEIKMFGHMVPLRAEVTQLKNTSQHADYKDMLGWLENLKQPPRKIFITHGENKASEALKETVEEKFGWECCVPEYMHEETLL